jgi:hypothetical protein
LRKASLDKSKTDLSQQLQKISLPVMKKSIVEYCRMASQRLRSFGPEERQRFLRYVLRDIVFDGATVRIRGVIPVSGDRTATHPAPDKLASPNTSVGDIAPTKIGDCGHNTTADFQGFIASGRDLEEVPFFAFEIERAIIKEVTGRPPVPPHNNTQSKLAA